MTKLLESKFQRHVKKRLTVEFTGCLVLKNDSGLLQGIPDLLVLYQDHWAMLEVKAARDSPQQPNQEYYIELLNFMSFAAFIYPENEDEVFDAIQQAFQPSRATRVSKRK